MRSKPSTASAIATPSSGAISEFYFGGAGDSVSRLVQSYAEARQRYVARAPHQVHYFTQSEAAAARRHAERAATRGRQLVLIGHSWGADTALTVAASLDAPVALLAGVDPVAKPGKRNAARPKNVDRILHVDAIPHRTDRSDAIKWMGRALGGVPRVFLDAEIQILVRAHHADFISMLREAGEDGLSLLDHVRALLPPRVPL